MKEFFKFLVIAVVILMLFMLYMVYVAYEPVTEQKCLEGQVMIKGVCYWPGVKYRQDSAGLRLE